MTFIEYHQSIITLQSVQIHLYFVRRCINQLTLKQIKLQEKVLLTPLAKPLVVLRAKLWSKCRVDPSGLPSTLHHTDNVSQVLTLQFLLKSFSGCLPGDDKSSANAGLNASSSADPTWYLNARRRCLYQIVDIGVDAESAVLPVCSSHIHQHHNISKTQLSIDCRREIHLHMQIDTFITTDACK